MPSTEKEPCVVHLICSSGFYGAEKVVCNLCQDPPAKNMAVLCLSNQNNAIPFFKNSIVQNGVNFYSSKNDTRQAIKALINLTKEHEAVVIHAHGYKEVFIACLFQNLRKCKIIVTQHGFTARNFKSKCYNLVNLALCRWGKIDSVVCVTQDIYLQHQNFGVPMRRLILLRNGIHFQTRLNKMVARAHIETRYGLPHGVPIILYAGRLSDEKDPLLFADIVREMNAAQAYFVAVIAGEGPLEKEITERLEALVLTDRVKMLGFVESMDTLLAAADILFLTSKTEGTPMVVLEAMAQGCPVIASNVGGLSEIIKNNQDGLLINSRDPGQYSSHCIELLSDAKKLKSISKNSYRKVRAEYSLSKHRPIYQEFYGSSR